MIIYLKLPRLYRSMKEGNTPRIFLNLETRRQQNMRQAHQSVAVHTHSRRERERERGEGGERERQEESSGRRQVTAWSGFIPLTDSQLGPTSRRRSKRFWLLMTYSGAPIQLEFVFILASTLRKL